MNKKVEESIEKIIKEAENLKNLLKKPFNIDTCTENEFRSKCRELGYRPEKIEKLTDHLFSKLSHKEIGIKWGISEDSSWTLRSNLKSEFLSKLREK